MKRCLYLISIITMTLCLAACGKAVSSSETSVETEEMRQAYVIEGEEPETVKEGEIIVREDLLNVGFLQASNLEPWQVMQTESFYMAFAEIDGYHLNISDAHGDAAKQTELLHQLIEAPMDVLFIVPVDSNIVETYKRLAEDAGIKVFFLDAAEENAMSGDEARKLLESEE